MQKCCGGNIAYSCPEHCSALLHLIVADSGSGSKILFNIDNQG